MLQPIALYNRIRPLLCAVFQEQLLFVGGFPVKEGNGGNVVLAKGGNEPGHVDERGMATRFRTVKKAENINPEFLSLVDGPVNRGVWLRGHSGPNPP